MNSTLEATGDKEREETGETLLCKFGLHDKGWWKEEFYSEINGKPFGPPAQTFFWWWECRRCGKRKPVTSFGG